MNRKELHASEFQKAAKRLEHPGILHKAVRILKHDPPQYVATSESPSKLAHSHAKVRAQKALLAQQTAQAGFIIKQKHDLERPGSASKTSFKKVPASRKKLYNDHSLQSRSNQALIGSRALIQGKIVNQNGTFFSTGKSRNVMPDHSLLHYRTEPKQIYQNYAAFKGVHLPSELTREIQQAFHQQSRYTNPIETYDSPEFDDDDPCFQIQSPRFQDPNTESDSIFSDSPGNSRPNFLSANNEPNAFLISLRRDGPEEETGKEETRRLKKGSSNEQSQKRLKGKGSKKSRKLSDDDECMPRIESGRFDQQPNLRTVEEEKMVKMLDNIVDELKPYYFFNQKRTHRNSEPEMMSLSESATMTPGFMGSPREHSNRMKKRERGQGSIGSSISLGTFGRDQMKQYRLNVNEEVKREEQEIEERKRKKIDKGAKGTAQLIMEKHLKVEETILSSGQENTKTDTRKERSFAPQNAGKMRISKDNKRLMKLTVSPGRGGEIKIPHIQSYKEYSLSNKSSGGKHLTNFDSLEGNEFEHNTPSEKGKKYKIDQDHRQLQMQNYMSSGGLDHIEIQSGGFGQYGRGKKQQPSQQKMQQKHGHTHDLLAEEQRAASVQALRSEIQKSSVPAPPPINESDSRIPNQRVNSDRKQTPHLQKNKFLSSGGRKALTQHNEKQKEKLALALMQQEHSQLNQKNRNTLASKVTGVRKQQPNSAARAPSYKPPQFHNSTMIQDWSYYSGQMRGTGFPRRDPVNTTFTFGSSNYKQQSSNGFTKQMPVQSGKTRSVQSIQTGGIYRTNNKNMNRGKGLTSQQARDELVTRPSPLVPAPGISSFLDSSISNYDLKGAARKHQNLLQPYGNGRVEGIPRSSSSAAKPSGRSFSPVYL